ncbi:MAG: hypothetical protein ACLP29_02805, partial [Dissulfurispiraceae bacterium]
ARLVSILGTLRSCHMSRNQSASAKRQARNLSCLQGMPLISIRGGCHEDRFTHPYVLPRTSFGNLRQKTPAVDWRPEFTSSYL